MDDNSWTTTETLATEAKFLLPDLNTRMKIFQACTGPHNFCDTGLHVTKLIDVAVYMRNLKVGYEAGSYHWREVDPGGAPK